MADATVSQNLLAGERSPYLLSHATNPVHWQPWGVAAFERAAREDRPVFLSIGYSACHWCHVMEHESFVDPETAKLLNDHFVSVKVDREERPDVDQIYQIAHQLMSQRSGGWPLSIFLTPDKRPFFGGTYFPNVPKYGMPSFKELLVSIHDAWKNRRSEIHEHADDLTQAITRAVAPKDVKAQAVSRESLRTTCTQLLRRADPRNGGFGRAPKFPSTMTVDLLWADAAVNDHAPSGEHVLLTLDRMDRGGIHDHLGGGFARYSTDEKWLVPHFEKMQYDNAQLTQLYLEGWRLAAELPPSRRDATRTKLLAVIGDVLTYILREMTSAHGTFYSAQDADSEGVEGAFFVWTPERIRKVIGETDTPIVCAHFDVTPEGNFEHGNSVLWTPRSTEATAQALGIEKSVVETTIARSRPLLHTAREQRPKPARDEKCLALWNALTISALADAGATLNNSLWLDAARKALSHWNTHAWNNGLLRHAIKDGTAYGEGYLDDHAGMAHAALTVWEATGDPTAFTFARELLDALITRFWIDQDADFSYSAHDAELVLVRTRDPHDHAYPGGTGLAADLLLRMGTITGNDKFLTMAQRLLERLSTMATDNPMGMSTVVRAIDRLARGSVEVVIVGDPARDDTRALVEATRGVSLPHRVLVQFADVTEPGMTGLDPNLTANRATGVDGSAVAYVCRRTVCSAPVKTPDELRSSLLEARRG